MFSHYLIIALRNIRKYALQNTVSILGLAAGFVCLSLSALWIHYEESYDTFHKGADRTFTLSRIVNWDTEPQKIHFDALWLATLWSRSGCSSSSGRLPSAGGSMPESLQ